MRRHALRLRLGQHGGHGPIGAEGAGRGQCRLCPGLRRGRDHRSAPPTRSASGWMPMPRCGSSSPGTAANAIALSMLAQPHEAVLAHHAAHICTDETGAPGFFGHGVGLIGLPGFSGKIDPRGAAGGAGRTGGRPSSAGGGAEPDPVHRIWRGLFRGGAAASDRAREAARASACIWTARDWPMRRRRGST